MNDWAAAGLEIGLPYVVILFVGIVRMPTLATVFRQRLREELARIHRTQTALADYLKLDGGQVSRILKYDQAAGATTVARLESIAAFLRMPPSNLLRVADDEPVMLTEIERELLELIRMLPDTQQQNLSAWLAYVFPERRGALAERAVLRQLNLARQRERDQEREEMKQLRKKGQR